jgi:hypothetical protein
MSIQLSGINADSIEKHLIQNDQIDVLCCKFAKLSISSIRHGSILLMVHPNTDVSLAYGTQIDLKYYIADSY